MKNCSLLIRNLLLALAVTIAIDNHDRGVEGGFRHVSRYTICAVDTVYD